MYNVPSGNIAVDFTGATTPTLVSYTPLAIGGADNFFDDGVTVKDIFDVIVSTTREVTPTCTFSTIRSHPLIFTDPPSIKSGPPGHSGTYMSKYLRG